MAPLNPPSYTARYLFWFLERNKTHPSQRRWKVVQDVLIFWGVPDVHSPRQQSRDVSWCAHEFHETRHGPFVDCATRWDTVRHRGTPRRVSRGTMDYAMMFHGTIHGVSQKCTNKVPSERCEPALLHTQKNTHQEPHICFFFTLRRIVQDRLRPGILIALCLLSDTHLTKSSQTTQNIILPTTVANSHESWKCKHQARPPNAMPEPNPGSLDQGARPFL